ncbi:MAG TPA: cytochrome C [Chitinophagaceae bacterium]|nr:cytochrome C [Chitinophagaceae bacterium]HAN37965.1 cytochrome C [Chitinophagaceae bacterium]
MAKKIGVVLVLALIVIQFFRPEKNITTQPATTHISKLYTVPADVEQILVNACYDCHSNNTVYPWYSNIQPVAWWLADHVEDGKKHLNFDTYTTYNLRRQYHKMEEVVEQVEANEMPMKSYKLAHSNARLTDAQKQLLINWANSVMNTMKAQYPIDSLVKKR